MSEKEKDKIKERKRRGFKIQLFFIMSVIMAAVFLPTSALLCVGMMPTFVAILVDRSRKKTKAITVGAMNLAGCAPFLFELWMKGHSLDTALDIATNPKAIVVMYGAAAIGYLMDWALTGLVAGVLYQRGVARQNAITIRQQELVERWGKEVSGEIPLDQYGFPLESAAKEP